MTKSDNEKGLDFKIDFAGIGAPKCATTWIYECLREHPQICLAPKDQLSGAFFLQPQPDQDWLKNYKAYFAGCQPGQIKGDFHVHYMYREDTAERMRRHNPKLKLIVSLRNPVDALYSRYRYGLFIDSRRWKDFEQTAQRLQEAGFYYRRLKNFFDAFPRENILVLIYEDIEKDRVAFIQQIYKFLAVKADFVPPSAFVKINPTQFKLTKLGRFVHKVIVPQVIKTRWGRTLKQSPWVKKSLFYLSEFYSRRNPLPPMSQKTRQHLQKIYAKDIKRLEKLIKRDLSFWR